MFGFAVKLSVKQALKPYHFDALLSTRPASMTALLALHHLSMNEAALAEKYGFQFAGDRRLGVLVAKRHVRSSVWRNGIKRQIRESFRLQVLKSAVVCSAGNEATQGTSQHIPSGAWLIRIRGPVTSWDKSAKNGVRAQADLLFSRVLDKLARSRSEQEAQP